VLLDVDLPGLDGFSLYERLRAARPDGFAVVFFTAHASEAEQLRAYRAGVIDFVTKPVNMRILMAKLRSWLDRAGARGAAAAE
jgi:DNA-binding response OmpR family regulator